MTNSSNKTSLRAAALITGIGLLISVISAPFAELFVYPKLVIAGDAAETVKNILEHRSLFVAGMFGYLVTFICDAVVAWALYILLKPVHKDISLLTALFRWLYTIIGIVAVLHLVTAFRLLTNEEYVKLFQPDQLQAQVMLSLNLFRNHWYFGLLFFSIHLGLLGYLVIRSGYIPWILGILLTITGAGYLLTPLKPYWFQDINVDFAQYTYYGELVFMLWLLIRGWRIKEQKSNFTIKTNEYESNS